MGAQSSKTAGKDGTAAENPGEAAVSPAKANGQENGHLKVNGDASPAAAEQKEEVQTNGTATAEDGEKDKEAPAEKEATDGDKANTEAIAPTEEEAAKAEDGSTPSTNNETPKKKKKLFSFKKSFKLSGFSFRKTKKETGANSEEAVAAGSDEDNTDGAVEGVSEEKAQTAEEEAKPEQNPVEETKATSPAAKESKTEENAAEPAVVTEPSPSQNEAAAAAGDSALSVQEAECSAEAQAEAPTE